MVQEPVSRLAPLKSAICPPLVAVYAASKLVTVETGNIEVDVDVLNVDDAADVEAEL